MDRSMNIYYSEFAKAFVTFYYFGTISLEIT